MHVRNRSKRFFIIMLLVITNFSYLTPVVGEESKLIKDSQLEQVIRFKLDKLEGELTVPDLERLKELNGNDMKVKSLEGLQYAKQLTKLSLNKNQISDLTPLENLQNLEALYLEGNPISDISPISGLTYLKKIYFMGTQVSDLTPLSSMRQLVDINFNSARVKDLTPLSTLTSLKSIELMQNSFSDLSPLSNLKNLEKLAIGSNKRISDLAPLQGLTNLKVLWITEDGIKDIGSLSYLDNLVEINAYTNEIEDLSPLQNLQKLELVNFDNNKIQDASPLLNLKKLKTASLLRNPISEPERDEITKHVNSIRLAESNNQLTAPTMPATPEVPKTLSSKPSSVFPGQSSRKMEFTDVTSGDWYYEDIRWAVDNRMVNGYDDGTFVPDAKVTEAEFLKMLISLYNGDLTAMEGEPWFNPYYKFADEHKWNVSGISYVQSVLGVNRDYFLPNLPIIRLEVAMILLNAIGKETDAPDELIWEMYNNGFSEGKTSKSLYGFQIYDLLTRAEAVAFLRNFKESNPNNELLVVSQLVEANRILSITRILTAVHQLASEKDFQVEELPLHRKVKEEGSIIQRIRVTSEHNPSIFVSIDVYALLNQTTAMNINVSEEGKPFAKEILNRLLNGQECKKTFLDAFEMMPNATPGTIDFNVPYNQSHVKFGTNSFNMLLDESDKAPFGSPK